MKPKILVAGIGNIFLGDDAFGSEVLQRLLLQEWPANVQVEDFGIRSFDLAMSLVDGYDALILVDAAPRGGEPGTVYTIEPDPGAFDRLPQEAAAIDPHGMDPIRVLGLARTMGAQIRNVLIVGCEPSPETVDPDGGGMMGLSEPVRAAIPEAIRIIQALVAQITAEVSRPRVQSSGGD